jgi:hypothetical protein
MNKINEYENKIEKSNEYIKHLEEMLIQYTQLKNDNILDRDLWINKLKEEKEKSIIIEDPLISFAASKVLSHNELDNLRFTDRNIYVNVCDLKIGDYIEAYYKNDIVIGRISRRTDKTLFINTIKQSDTNESCEYKFMYGNNDEYLHSICNYYYINIIDNQNISNIEIKIFIKNVKKFRKATNNFISKSILDFTN